MHRYFLPIILLLLAPALLPAQIPDSLQAAPADSLPEGKPRRSLGGSLRQANGYVRERAYRFDDFLHDEPPSPKKALLFSLALPGLGQAYNHKDWKVPIVYAAVGTMGYVAFYNRNQYIRFRTAYLYRLDGDPDTVDEFEGLVSNPATLRSLRDRSRLAMERSFVGLGLIYLLNGVDAFVDAHLATFDTNEDLGWRLRSGSSPLQIGPDSAPMPSIGLYLDF